VKTPETINSRSWARAARRHCRIRKSPFGGKYIHAWVNTIPNLGRIRARPCYVWGRSDADGRRERFPELTGGWKIEVQPQDPGFFGSQPRTRKFHVSGPVDLAKLSRAMARAERHLLISRCLISARSELKRYVAGKRLPPRLRTMAERRKLPMCYSDMTLEHCQAWLSWASSWADKEPQP
jgi:hypothetical protein